MVVDFEHQQQGPFQAIRGSQYWYLLAPKISVVAAAQRLDTE